LHCGNYTETLDSPLRQRYNRCMAADPLSTVKQELLVRYLDAWAPAALHSARHVTYVDGYADRGDSAIAALRVFAEFADVLDRHQLTMVIAGTDQARLAALTRHLTELASGVPGLRIHPVAGDRAGQLLDALLSDRALTTPLLAYLDAAAPAGLVRAPDGRPPPGPELLAALAGGRSAEVFIAVSHDQPLDPGSYRRALLAAGFSFAVVAELVDNAGQGQLLFFATSAAKSLERFKDALWAVDEYAGVRYRDPRTPDHPLLDISLEPHVGPLRRALVARLAERGAETVAQLRQYALAETLYRPADVTRALAPLLAAGQITREPERGRLTPQTVVRSRSADQ
jgi:DNA-binding transcriptional ArsR family regulator